MRVLLLKEDAKKFLDKHTDINKPVKANIGGVFQEDDQWTAFDTTSGEMFVESFHSPLEATVYAMGQPAYFHNLILSC